MSTTLPRWPVKPNIAGPHAYWALNVYHSELAAYWEARCRLMESQADKLCILLERYLYACDDDPAPSYGEMEAGIRECAKMAVAIGQLPPEQVNSTTTTGD